MADPVDANVIRSLRQLVGLYPRWALPAVMALGLMSFAMEGIGISLFIPLLQILQGQETGLPDDGPFAAFGALLARVPPDRRLVAIGGLILAAIVLKNAIGYGNMVLHSL